MKPIDEAGRPARSGWPGARTGVSPEGRFLGVVVPPAYAQDRGAEQVLDTLAIAPVTAICTYPAVARPVDTGRGSRMPDLHVDGHRRVLERPLWGKRELWVESVPAYEPQRSRSTDDGYPTPPPPSMADIPRPTAVDDLVHVSRQRGISVYLQVSPLVIPGLRDEDRPVRIDGARLSGTRVADTACLNSPAAQAYACGQIADIVDHYPDAHGLMFDWAEFPAYTLEDVFACYCRHCEARAREWGFPWAAIKRDVWRAWARVHAMSSTDLKRLRTGGRRPSALVALLSDYPGLQQSLAFRARSVSEFYRSVRTVLDNGTGNAMAVTARTWAPPWNRISGSNYWSVAAVCDAVAPKIFTFDYAALPRWYGQQLADWNPALQEGEILDAMVDLMDLPDDRRTRTFGAYQIPAPGEPHATAPEAHADRIAEVVSETGGRALCHPIAHAYLPEPQWRTMVEVIRDGPADGMWVQMYGYLTDRKIAILSETWSESSAA